MARRRRCMHVARATRLERLLNSRITRAVPLKNTHAPPRSTIYIYILYTTWPPRRLATCQPRGGDRRRHRCRRRLNCRPSVYPLFPSPLASLSDILRNLCPCLYITSSFRAPKTRPFINGCERVQRARGGGNGDGDGTWSSRGVGVN